MHFIVPVAFLAGSVGPGEVVLLFLVILVLFGPRRLPDMARQLGRMVSELRRASQNFRDQVMQMDREPPTGEKTGNLPGALLPSERPDAKPGETRDGRAGFTPAILLRQGFGGQVADVPPEADPPSAEKSALPDPEPGEKEPHDRAG